MRSTHTDSAIEAACSTIIERDHVLPTTDAVIAYLRQQAGEDGKPEVGARRARVGAIVNKFNKEWKARRAGTPLDPSGTATDRDRSPALPPSMADAFTQCERTVAMGWAQHLAEQAAQAERSTAARLAALTTETMTYATMLEGTVATLERQLTEVTTEGEALEAARAHADAEIGRLTVALETSGRAQVALDVDCAAQRARTTASEAQLLRAAERAHDAQRGLDAATGELALLAQRLTWVEGTATTLQSALDLQTTRASEAEQARDLATGRLSALEDEIRHLRHPVTAPTLRMTVVD